MLSKTQFDAFRQDFKQAVKSLEQKYGMTIELGNITYNSMEFHSKMTATKVDDSGQKQVDQRKFETAKRLLGFQGNIGDKYSNRGIVFTITGLDTGKPKYPVLATGSDGKGYKVTVESANAMLKLHPAK